ASATGSHSPASRRSDLGKSRWSPSPFHRLQGIYHPASHLAAVPSSRRARSTFGAVLAPANFGFRFAPLQPQSFPSSPSPWPHHTRHSPAATILRKSPTPRPRSSIILRHRHSLFSLLKEHQKPVRWQTLLCPLLAKICPAREMEQTIQAGPSGCARDKEVR